jgi:DNA modification methylase
MLSQQQITDEYALYHGDSAEVLESLPDESIHMWIYSPPFATESGGALYNYSSSDRDLSNARSYDEFFQHYGYIVEHTARLLLPGRISAVHCMDVPKKGANIAGYTDFPGDIIRLHERCGFEMLPRICIWKEPLAVRTRTMSKALTHAQIVSDSCQTNVAAADYLIPFRKRGENPVPVTHPTGFHTYSGEREIPTDVRHLKGYEGNQIKNRFSHWIWRQYASCFWDDIRLERTLPYKEGRDEKDERHMHPLQLDVIDRCCALWTNPGETVGTPFMGVGSEVYGAVINNRRGLGCELKESYFNQACKNVPKAVQDRDIQGGLF